MTPSVILLADDDQADTLLLDMAFKRSELAVDLKIVHDGQQVLHYLRGEGGYCDRARYPLPDLILLDLRMPHMDGFEVLAWLKRQMEFSSVPVIVIGGCATPDRISRAFQSGARCVLSKTANVPEFADALISLVDTFLSSDAEKPGRVGL